MLCDAAWFRGSFTGVRKFLLSRIGRHMDEVYSELVAKVPTSVSRYDLDESIHWQTKYSWSPLKIDESGVLRRRPKEKRSSCRGPKVTILELGGTLYHKHEGIWYRVAINREPVEAVWHIGVRDVFGTPIPIKSKVIDYFGNKRTVIGNASAAYTKYGKRIHCTWKQQAGKKECRKLEAGLGVPIK